MEKLHGFVLAYTQYKDHDAILRAFTLEQGFQSFYIRGLYAPKNKKKSYLSPLNSLLMSVQLGTKTGTLPVIQQIEPLYKDISPPSFQAGAMLFFVADFLCQVLRHEGENPAVYRLVEEVYSEACAGNHQSHLVFLVRFIALCGIAPWLSEGKYLDPEGGRFLDFVSGGVFSADISAYWKQILASEFPFSVKVEPANRRALLESILRYYKCHHPEFSTPKSLEVLYEMMD